MKNFFKMMLLVCCLLMTACTKEADNPKWEYKVVVLNGIDKYATFDATEEESERVNKAYSKVFVDSSLEYSLQAEGQQGWELVDVVEMIETVHPNFGDEKYVTGLQPNTRTQELQLVFKRKISDNISDN